MPSNAVKQFFSGRTTSLLVGSGLIGVILGWSQGLLNDKEAIGAAIILLIQASQPHDTNKAAERALQKLLEGVSEEEEDEGKKSP